jgi:gamma-glutamyl:cysteine ligase YbdK (ATP-grasp superfamily)
VSARSRYHLFEVIGIEIEYMVVRADTLDVLPAVDTAIREEAGHLTNEFDRDGISWSNELVAHVMELKVTEPVTGLDGLAARFAENAARVNAILAPGGGRLMPSGAHPWMDPARDARLWPHEYTEIYHAFDRIFGCRTHGWTNLQSVHVNLPFADDAEFGALHAAIRVLLPILPGLAASSPFLDARRTGLMDSRLDAYRSNALKIPSITGAVIPERCFSRRAYRERILNPLYRDAEPHDPERILRYEWVNARGAIARFERNTIEIRVLDVQECPRADIAVVWAVIEVLKALVAERWTAVAEQKRWEIGPLRAILLDTIRDGERAVISDPAYLRLFGWTGTPRATVGELWAHVRREAIGAHPEFDAVLAHILGQGPLARRVLRRAGDGPDRPALAETYRELCECLAGDRLFR